MTLSRREAEALIAAAAARGQPAGSVRACRAAIEACPGIADFWFDLGYYLRQDEQPRAALDAYARALALGGSEPEMIRLNRAVILSDDLLDDAGAEAELEAALALRPGWAPALMNLGNLYEERGDRAGAIACYGRLLEREQAGEHVSEHGGEARARLLRLEAMEEGGTGPAVRALRKAFEEGAALWPSETRANLGFALGQVLEREGRIADAHEAYRQANAIACAPYPRYDHARAEVNAQALIDTFSAPRPAPAEGGGDLIFICGLHRSGSSLAERVLSMHGDVAPCGELAFLQRLAARDLAPFPSGAARLDADVARAAAARYRERIEAIHPPREGLRYTDKRPQNFLLIGLILQIFPEAKIIHTERDRRDVMVSIFGQHLDPRAAAYAGDPLDIAHYMGLHARIMAHWRTLYPGAIFDLDYDAFVRAPADELARLTGWLGLSAQPGMLDFHARPGLIKTASYWQVRNPVNTASSGRWRAWAPFMGGAFDALASAGLTPGRGEAG
ncbi:MAG: sulfotransferase [Oceanicaulis sp.]|nr:sulfotransferase [Oceanicaulis sp.]